MHTNRLQPVIWGTTIMTGIAVIPLLNFINLFFCSGIILGGMAGVFIYSRHASAEGVPLTHKDGVMIGLLSGILSAVLVSGINMLMMMYSDVNPVIEVSKMLNESGIKLPQEVDLQLSKFSDEFSRYGFSPTIAVFSLVSNMIIYPLFGILGGLLGVTIKSKRTNKTER
ncbi:MAG: hypothetical protein NTV87_09825 [Ignavibacteriae bacterium]|jgi:hypothetical protein|nr:hypothetical protein [Ignavibacteriota bacterium]